MDSMRMMWTIVLLFAVINVNDCQGKRNKTEVTSDVASTAYSKCVHDSRKEYYRRVRDPEKHISTRLTRYFTFGGILQAISEATGLPRDTLVAGGPSELQDQTSGCGHGTHAAHIIRVGSINPKLQQTNSSLYKAMQNYIGHTQNILSFVNVWEGIGGAIDRYQSNNLAVLATINFRGKLLENWDNVTTLQAGFREIVDKCALTDTSNKARKKQLAHVRDTVYLVQPCMLFADGIEGYKMVERGEFLKRYTRKRSRSNSKKN